MILKLAPKNFVILLLFSPIFMWAHNGNISEYKLDQCSDFISINAVLPWTIKKALDKKHPKVYTKISQKQYEEWLREYFAENLLLISDAEKKLNIIEITPLETKHSDHLAYNILFEPGNILRVKNTVMFDFSEKHQNHMVFKSFPGNFEKTFTHNDKELILNQNFSLSNLSFVLSGFAAIVLIIGIFFAYKR